MLCQATTAAAATAPDWWEQRSTAERHIIIDHLYEMTGHAMPCADEADAAQRVSELIQSRNDPSAQPTSSARGEASPAVVASPEQAHAIGSAELDVGTELELLPEVEELAPELTLSGTALVATAAIASEVNLGVWLYAHLTINDIGVNDQIQYWGATLYPAGYDIYWGARLDRSSYLFQAWNFGTVRWFEPPCTFSGKIPPDGARLRQGVPTDGAKCVYTIPDFPYQAEAPIFVDYPYLLPEDVGLSGPIETKPRGSEPHNHGVPAEPTPPVDEDAIERELERDGIDLYRSELLVSIVTQRLEELDEQNPSEDDDGQPIPVPLPITEDTAEQCLKAIEELPGLPLARLRQR